MERSRGEEKGGGGGRCRLDGSELKQMKVKWAFECNTLGRALGRGLLRTGQSNIQFAFYPHLFHYFLILTKRL